MTLESLLFYSPIFLVPFLILGFSLWIRYGVRRAFLVAFVITLSCNLVTIAAPFVFKPGEHPALYPPTDWVVIRKVDGASLSFDYRREEGLYALSDMGDVLLTPPKPTGIPDGTVEEKALNLVYQDEFPIVRFEPGSAELSPPAGHPVKDFQLLNPPGDPVDRVTFLLGYPTDWDVVAVVGYAIYENGEVRCAERYIRVGPEVMYDQLATGIADLLFFALEWYLGSLVVFSLVAIWVLERKRKAAARREA